LPVERAASRTAEAERLRAVVLAISAFACFAALDASAKLMGTLGFHLVTVMWLRFAGHVIFSAVTMRGLDPVRLLRTPRWRLQLLRGLLLFGATLCNFTAVRYLQLAETGAINFAIPLLVAAFAVPVLGERVGIRRWAAIVVGFVGVLVIVRPTPELFQPAMILSLCSVVCSAFYVLTTRLVAQTDGHQTSNAYAAVVGVCLTTPLVPFFWTTPGGIEWLVVAALGLFGGLGHYLLTAASQHAPAPVIAPLWYTQIVWAILIGYLAFADVPDAPTLLGAGIVLVSGLYVAYRERRLKGTAEAAESTWRAGPR
jgi:drug/metabolite transporter (DMT)-like permease